MYFVHYIAHIMVHASVIFGRPNGRNHLDQKPKGFLGSAGESTMIFQYYSETDMLGAVATPN